MNTVKPKKQLGQHFLKDQSIAKRIVDSLDETTKAALEIGPGMGVLTQYLLEKPQLDLRVVELDQESVDYLENKFKALENRIIAGDFLRLSLDNYFTEPFSIIGNFPYNISSQILFKVLDYRNQIPEVVGMFQKEVADRVCAGPGSKTYGIISVLIQSWYTCEYLFTVQEGSFNPPPKVKSAVIRLKRNTNTQLECDEKLFIRVVKTAFNQRRKTLRNALRVMLPEKFQSEDKIWKQRAEQLSLDEFVQITQFIANTGA